MIGYLKGKVIAELGGEIWLEVGGVGYRVRVGKVTSQNELELYIHTAVREDAITLYGFDSLDELKLFELLISVSGVGPKTGMEIVGNATHTQIESAIATADVNFFSKIKGIGKKSAQRIIVDLKSKIGSLKEIDLSTEDEEDPVFMALKQFGFKPSDIQTVMKQMDRTQSEQDQIKIGLKMLGKAVRPAKRD